MAQGTYHVPWKKTCVPVDFTRAATVIRVKKPDQVEGVLEGCLSPTLAPQSMRQAEGRRHQMGKQRLVPAWNASRRPASTIDEPSLLRMISRQRGLLQRE
jgi:hypothetical protein